jgi:serine/threonine-protein kinase
VQFWTTEQPGTRSCGTVSLGDAWHDVPRLPPRLGRYEVRGLLGAGGMGAVFEGFDPVLGRAVAIKVERAAAARRERDAARLRREGTTTARLSHPNVVRVYDLGVADGHAFVVLELVRGSTLAGWLADAVRTPAEIIAAYVQAGRGLAAVHDAGLVHRDFKPENVLVGDDGRVVVADFGLARAVGEAPVAEEGRVVGTPAFMAPEQRAAGPVDARADQYSFCLALLSDLAAARRPVAAAVRNALRRGLCADPGDRFPTMHDLLAVLDRASNSRAPRGSRAQIAPRPPAERPAGARMAGGALLARGADHETRHRVRTRRLRVDRLPAPDRRQAAHG